MGRGGGGYGDGVRGGQAPRRRAVQGVKPHSFILSFITSLLSLMLKAP